MRTTPTVLVALTVLAMAPLVNVSPVQCVPTRADPATTIVIDLPGGRRIYDEERGSLIGTIPGAGYLTGEGTWFYEEINGIDEPEGSLQRGGLGEVCFPPPPLACLFHDQDPVKDVNCGAGPDRIMT